MNTNTKIVYLLLVFTLFGLIIVNELSRAEGLAKSSAGQSVIQSRIAAGFAHKEAAKATNAPPAPEILEATSAAPNARKSYLTAQDARDHLELTKSESVRRKNEKLDTKMKVAFAITITKDGSVIDGACVLAYSIIKAHKSSDLEVSFIAFVHPTAKGSGKILTRFGYQVIVTPNPVNESAIRGKFLREHINDKAGCCGAKELLKLYSYRMMMFDWVVHVDVDVMFLKGLDSILQFTNYSILYTTDPNMAGSKLVERQPAQGGFLVIKPSMKDYENYINILMEGDYRSGSAWGGTKIGWFWGGKTIQGIVPYYYNKYTTPGRSLILDRCIYNTMADTDNCSVTPVQDIVSAHFTVCQKPWSCSAWQQNKLCVALHRRWFELRIEAEQYYSIPPPKIDKHCAQGRDNYDGIDATYAKVPDDFKSKFNGVTVPSNFNPTCGSGYYSAICD